MKSYTIRTTKQAERDIDNLHYFIYEICKSPITSKRYISGLFVEIKSLSHTAESYKISTHKSVLKYGYNARRVNYRKIAIVYTLHRNIVLI